MGQKLSAVYDEATVAEIEELAAEYDVPRQEVLRQLVEVGLEQRRRA